MSQCCYSASVWRLCALLFLSLLYMPYERTRPPAAAQETEEGPLHRQFGFSRTKAVTAKSEQGNENNSQLRPGNDSHGAASGKKPGHRPQPQSGKVSQATGSAEPLALGYSILQAEKAAEGARILLTESAKVFRIGDRVRLLVETNADGYLYVFNTLDGKDPEMIFPSYRLNGGNNRIEAHVPCETPSRENRNPELQWFEFQPPPGAERLYLVFSLDPLASVPIGQELIAHCQRHRDCFAPQAEVWNQIIAEERLAKQTESLKGAARPLTGDMDDSVTRRIRLPADAPTPTELRQNKLAGSRRIVVVVSLESR